MTEQNITELSEDSIVEYLRYNIRPTFTKAEFIWEFMTNRNPVVFKVLTSNNKILASQAMLPVKLNVKGVIVETAKSETSFLSPLYRGKNYFENLYFSAIEEAHGKGCQMIWGFTPAVKVWKEKLSFDIVKSNISEASILLSKYPSNLEVKKNTHNKVLQYGKIILFSFLRLVEKRPSFIVNSSSIVIEYSFPEESVLRDFQNRFNEAHDISVSLPLDAQFIRWRILDNPALEYRYLFFYEKGILVGYVVFSFKYDRLSLGDFSFLESEIGYEILAHVIKQYATKVSSVFYFGNDDSAFGKKIFDMFIFFQAKVNKSSWANMVIKDVSKNKSYQNVIEPAHWHVNGLWTEGYSI